jgi:hypothetical protein
MALYMVSSDMQRALRTIHQKGTINMAGEINTLRQSVMDLEQLVLVALSFFNTPSIDKVNGDPSVLPLRNKFDVMVNQYALNGSIADFVTFVDEYTRTSHELESIIHKTYHCKEFNQTWYHSIVPLFEIERLTKLLHDTIRSPSTTTGTPEEINANTLLVRYKIHLILRLVAKN